MQVDPCHVFARLPVAKHYWLAISGGVDSIVLLHLFSAFAQSQSFSYSAIHINHGLSKNAEKWQTFCRELCEQWQIPFVSQQIMAHASPGESREAAARAARYHALQMKMSMDDCLLTAHHQDDQAETLLLQLFRGAGVKGLAAMKELQTISAGLLYRPLLNYTRAQIMSYANQYNLNWIEDESNVDQTFDRNFIRHELLPKINLHWPEANKTISRSAMLCDEAESLLEEMAAFDLRQVIGNIPHTLSITQLNQLSAARQRNVIRYWLQQEGHRLPSQQKLLQLQQDMLYARIDANPVVHWQGTEVRRYQDDLYVMKPLQKIDPLLSVRWNLTEPLTLPNELGVLSAHLVKGKGIFFTSDKNAIVTVRFRQGGERCNFTGRVGHRSLKKLMQEWHIPPWQRDRLPLIYIGNELVCVPGHYFKMEFEAKQYQYGWNISYKNQ